MERPCWRSNSSRPRNSWIFIYALRPSFNLIESGAYEIDADELAASDRLLARKPDAQMWLRRVGSRYAHRFGPRYQSVRE